MAGCHPSRSDRLWQFAYQLIEEETTSNPFARQEEEHSRLIQQKYNQLVSNLSCLGDIIAAMYQNEKLTPKESEQIQHLQSTPIRASEELLSIIARKPRDVFECFLSIIKDTNQLHLYQMLVSDDNDETSDESNRGSDSEHKDLIRRNSMWLSEKMDTDSGLIHLLYQQKVLTAREREEFFCISDSFRKNALLLGMLSKKSSEDFSNFLKALIASGQGHLAINLRKRGGGHAEQAIAPSASPAAPAPAYSKVLLNELDESEKKPISVPSLSKLVLLPKELSVPQPNPGSQLTSVQQYAMAVDVVANTTRKAINFRRTENVKFEASLKGLETRLQTDIAVKVICVYPHCLETPRDSLKICFRTLLQECDLARKEIVHTNKELEQLRDSAIHYSVAASLSDALREELRSKQQELISERLRNRKELLQLEHKLHECKTNTHNEIMKCKRLDDDRLLNNDIIMDTEYRLKEAEGDKNCNQQQVLEIGQKLMLHELESEKDQSEELEEKPSAAMKLEQFNRKPEDRDLTFSAHESHAIRNNHQFLVENIKSSSRLIHVLHKENCITDDERCHLIAQPSNFHKNDALLHWMRSITFKKVKSKKVLECFRRAEQSFVADLIENGGVLIKSKISTTLVDASSLSKSPSKNFERLIERRAIVIERLNERQRWSFSNSHVTISELADMDILIAPYCHQEADGIVIWFWCQSEKGQMNLEAMYESGTLLEKLSTIFEDYELLVPTSITIFLGDFKKNESGLSENYQSIQECIDTIRTKAAEEFMKAIIGFAILDKELFVVSEGSSELEVYDPVKFSFRRRLHCNELIYPKDIGSCNTRKCLYIIDYKDIGQSNEIIRVDTNGNLLSKWSTEDEFGYGLSVTGDSNLILTVYNKNELNEYSPEGQLLRKIVLSSDAGFRYPWHAIKLANGHFVISHGSDDDDLHRVCLADANGRLMKSFGGKRGSSIGQMNRPVYFSVDRNGFLVVVDQRNSRVLLLDSNLEFKREILSEEKHELRRPWRILLDETDSRMLVAVDEWGFAGMIKIFQF